MPRANRYLLPGQIAHVTHRCHNRQFWLRFARDRWLYRWWLWEGLRRYPVSLLAYALTSNHVHLLVQAAETEALSACIQLVHGRVAQQFMRRKQRTGAFWTDRFHLTMVESGKHLWRCLIYLDLNMVRAGAVEHPQAWPWCSYAELRGVRQRHQVLDTEKLLRAVGVHNVGEFLQYQDTAIEEALQQRQLARCPEWTESIAVGSAAFVRIVAAATTGRRRLQVEPWQSDQPGSAWVLRESASMYF